VDESRRPKSYLEAKTAIIGSLIALAGLMTVWIGSLMSTYSRIDAMEQANIVLRRDYLMHEAKDFHDEAARANALLKERLGRIEERLKSLERYVYTSTKFDHRPFSPSDSQQ